MVATRLGSEFCLHFIEGFAPEEPRHCFPVKPVSVGSYGEVDLLVKVDPPCSGRRYGPTDADVQYLLLCPTLMGHSLMPVSKWPLSVHVFVPQVDKPEQRDSLLPDELRRIALGEIRQINP